MRSIQVSHWPSNGGFPSRYTCGPLHLIVDGEDVAAIRAIGAALNLYRGFPFQSDKNVTIFVRRATLRVVAKGNYLTCARMLVDRGMQRCTASTRSGIGVERSREERAWTVSVPPVELDEPAVGDLEDVLSLILTEEWRDSGWEPMHAGCVVTPNGDGVLLCATSGGGKSTLTAALVRSGWQTLGDDKLLLSRRTGETFSLCRSFNLDPKSGRWFSELAEIGMLPRYSAWTEKRRVYVEQIWPGSLAWSSRAKYIVKLVRDDSVDSWWFHRLTARQCFSTLLGQVVVPNDPNVARMTVGAIANAASEAKGIELRVGSHAYEAWGIADALSAALA